MFNKYTWILAALVASQTAFFGTRAFALSEVVSAEANHPAWVLSSLLTEPDLTETRYGKLPSESKVSPYEKAQQILVLADTFETPFALAEEIHQLFPHAYTYKTSLSCPESLDHTELSSKLMAVRVDHNEDFQFADNQFDVITMKNGMCCCKGPEVTCAGVGLTQDRAFHFLSEVVRVLNKSNPNAIAFLQGSQMAFRGTSGVSMEDEAKNQLMLQHVLLQIEDLYPNIEAEFFFKSVTGRYALLKFRASEAIVEELTAGNFEDYIRYLDGIFIRVKGP